MSFWSELGGFAYRFLFVLISHWFDTGLAPKFSLTKNDGAVTIINIEKGCEKNK